MKRSLMTRPRSPLRSALRRDQRPVAAVLVQAEGGRLHDVIADAEGAPDDLLAADPPSSRVDVGDDDHHRVPRAKLQAPLRVGEGDGAPLCIGIFVRHRCLPGMLSALQDLRLPTGRTAAALMIASLTCCEMP